VNSIIIVLVSILASTATYFVAHDLKQGPVKASAILSFLVALVFLLLFHNTAMNYLITTIPLVFIGASFIGMSSKAHLKNLAYAAFAGLLFGFIFLYTTDLFKGYGGGLGTEASMSVLATLGIEYLIVAIIKKLNKK
jgi:hypothetical protein